MILKRAAGALVMAVAASANAGPGLTASVGTTGLGIHGTIPLTPKLSARVGANFLEYSDTDSTRDVTYEFNLKLRSRGRIAGPSPGKRPIPPHGGPRGERKPGRCYRALNRCRHLHLGRGDVLRGRGGKGGWTGGVPSSCALPRYRLGSVRRRQGLELVRRSWCDLAGITPDRADQRGLHGTGQHLRPVRRGLGCRKPGTGGGTERL